MNNSYFYLEQVRQQTRANEYVASIQQPGRELATMRVNAQGVPALALAIESCTPQQLAQWIHPLLGDDPAAFDDHRADLFVDENDGRADVSSP